MIEDLVSSDDDDSANPPAGPALMLPAKMGPMELLVAEELHRRDDLPAANTIVFTMLDEETGVEILEEGERWRKIMGWPTVPSIEDAQAFQLNVRRARLAKWWNKLRDAKAEDDKPPVR
ncbi:MAG: hypothetical protein JWO19_5976 [Bryobacterales bacterium]|nr:hypothetical protein [Bryobacterales bacterium]